MIALFAGLLGLAIAWWIVRRLILLALLVAAAALAAMWLTHARLLKAPAPSPAQLHHVQREIDRDVLAVLHHDAVIRRRPSSR